MNDIGMTEQNPIDELLRDIRIHLAIARQRQGWIFRSLKIQNKHEQERAESALIGIISGVLERYRVEKKPPVDYRGF